MTEFSLFGQKLYLSPILDGHNGDLVSCAILDQPVLSMVTAMLAKTFETIPNGAALILCSNQGWQYQHKWRRKAKGIRKTINRKVNCLDNAMAENCFGLFTSKLFFLQKFQSLEYFKQEQIGYLDYYNNRHIKAKQRAAGDSQTTSLFGCLNNFI